MAVQVIIRNPLDRDAREYMARAGVTDAAARTQINEFVRGMRSLGLWDKMVCWPLRSAQNASTSTTAHSLGGMGTFPGTLTNGPTWETDGIAFDSAASQRISTTLDISATSGAFTWMACYKRISHSTYHGIVGHRSGSEAIARLLFESGGVWGYTNFAGGNGAGYSSLVGAADSVWEMAGLALDQSGFAGNLFAGANTSNIAASAIIAGFSSGSFGIGAQGAGVTQNTWKGRIAWAAHFSSRLTRTQYDAARSLYIATLGQGVLS